MWTRSLWVSESECPADFGRVIVLIRDSLEDEMFAIDKLERLLRNRGFGFLGKFFVLEASYSVRYQGWEIVVASKLLPVNPPDSELMVVANAGCLGAILMNRG
jgi:hypothetical protein